MAKHFKFRFLISIVILLLFSSISFSQTPAKTKPKSKPKPIVKILVSGRVFYKGAWCEGITPTPEQEEEATRETVTSMAFFFQQENTKSPKKIKVSCDQNGFFETWLPPGDYSIISSQNFAVGSYRYTGTDTLKNLKLEEFMNKTERIIADLKIAATTSNIVIGFYQICNSTAE